MSTNDLVSPWVPMKNSIDLKHLGKLGEEVNELGAVISRCIIQGIDESEPVTGKVNRQWLTEEIADVLANIHLVSKHFNLDDEVVTNRVVKKVKLLTRWHELKG